MLEKGCSELGLVEFLTNVFQTCKISGISGKHFHDIKKMYEEHGIQGLNEKIRRKACLKNLLTPEVEEAAAKMAYGQLKVTSNSANSVFRYILAASTVTSNSMDRKRSKNAR